MPAQPIQPAPDAPAPFFDEIAEGPAGGRALWIRAADGVRLRLALWPEGARGTVLLLPGRTEYVEKYGRAAAELKARGFATATLDWRGQGLSDRGLPDAMIGHVARFADFQADLAAAEAAIAAEGMPGPIYYLCHSMGGVIALRALCTEVRVPAVVFTAPMWGIPIAAKLRPLAWVLMRSGTLFGQGLRYAPGTGPASYCDAAPFEDNALTTDAGSFAYMQGQLAARPELALGGPSLHWVREALTECRALRALASPAVPALTFLGARERVVDPAAIRERMARWPGGRLDLVEGAEHEVMMEGPETRARFFDKAAELFGRNT